jgi:hypothetical protein
VLEAEEESERLSVVEPPGGTVPEERAKLVWACKRLLNGNKSPVRSIKLLNRVDVFIRSGPQKWLFAKAQG